MADQSAHRGRRAPQWALAVSRPARCALHARQASLQDERWSPFSSRSGRDVHARAFTCTSSLGECLSPVVCGILTGTHSRKIRDAIVARPRHWQRIISSKAFHATGALDGDSHAPRAGMTRRTRSGRPEAQGLYCAGPLHGGTSLCARVSAPFIETCRTFAPLTQFVTTALELAW